MKTLQRSKEVLELGVNGVQILRAQGPPLNHLGGPLMTTPTAKDRLRLSRDPTGEMPRPGAPAPGGPAPRAAAFNAHAHANSAGAYTGKLVNTGWRSLAARGTCCSNTPQGDPSRFL